MSEKEQELESSFTLLARLAVIELSLSLSRTTFWKEHVQHQQVIPLKPDLHVLLFLIIGCVVVMAEYLRRPHFCQNLDGTVEDVLSHIGSDVVSRHEDSEDSGSLLAALNLPFYKAVNSSWLKPSQGCLQDASQEKAPAKLESRLIASKL